MYKIIQGNCLETLRGLEDKSVQCCVTSPPYYAMRDYGTGIWTGGDADCKHVRSGDRCKLCGAEYKDEQIGLEQTPEEYIAKMVQVFAEVKRVLKDDGTLWVNIADTYWGSGTKGSDMSKRYENKKLVQNGNKGSETGEANLPRLVGNYKDIKNKDLIGIPWMLAFAMRADGWYLRDDIIWAKKQGMPESVKDRCTRSYEHIFMFTKSRHYKFNRITTETGGNMRNVWTVSTSGGYKDEDGNHYATYSEELITPCIVAGTDKGDTVIDPFNGSGTTGSASIKMGRKYIGCELNPKYADMSRRRLDKLTSQTTLWEDI